jgi:hypothetical protein
MCPFVPVTSCRRRDTTKCCVSDTKFTLGRFPSLNNAAASLRRRVAEATHRLGYHRPGRKNVASPHVA